LNFLFHTTALTNENTMLLARYWNLHRDRAIAHQLDCEGWVASSIVFREETGLVLDIGIGPSL
jgi:hypothetical protein